VNVLVSVLGIGAMFVSLAARDSVLLLVSAMLLGFYLLVILRDVKTALGYFERLPSRERRENAFPGTRRHPIPLTSLGFRFFEQIEALRYRLHSLHSELEKVKAVKPSVGSLEIVGGVDVSAGQGEDELLRLFAKALEQVVNRHRCRMAAIVFATDFPGADEEHSTKLRVVASAKSGEQFEEQLKKYFVPFFEQGVWEGFGLHDELDSALGGFAAFGLRYTVSLPFKWMEAKKLRTGVLWLGYSAERPPLQNEGDLVREWIPALQAQLAAFQRIRELGDRAAEAESLDREKSEVIAHMSHDIRSPLSNIKAVLNLLKLENIGTGNVELIEVALMNCDSMQEIVEDLLDYARHRMGRLTARREVFNLGHLVRQVAEGYQLAARLKGLTLEVESSENNSFVNADRSQLRRVVSNLINNAIKYTARGGVTVLLATRADGLVEVLVRDSGVGMDAEQVEKLFLPFMRFHVSAAEGIGLGLALSKVLVELNGGKISVVSRAGLGSEFRLCLPRVAQPVQANELSPRTDTYLGTPDASRRRPCGAGLLEGRRILLVDDDAQCVESLARVLEMNGCQVLQAVKLSDAESIVNFEKLDAVISDGSMPFGGAGSLLDFIRKRRRCLPVLVVTGRSGEEQEYLARGACYVLIKPVDPKELIERIQEALDLSSVPDEQGQVMVA